MPRTRLACNQRLRCDQPLSWLRSDFMMQQWWRRVQFKEFIDAIQRINVTDVILRTCPLAHGWRLSIHMCPQSLLSYCFSHLSGAGYSSRVSDCTIDPMQTWRDE